MVQSLCNLYISSRGDRSFAKELEWSHLHFRSHVEQELYNVVYSEYITFSAEERGGPLFLKLLLLHLVISDEANLEMLLDTVKNYKINENVDNEDMDKVIRLLKGVTGTIITLRQDKTLPEKYIEHLHTQRSGRGLILHYGVSLHPLQSCKTTIHCGSFLWVECAPVGLIDEKRVCAYTVSVI